MAASQKVPLTVTYAPSGAATTTVTVLGQVLNNGQTNWVASGTNAIYLETSSANGEAQTVLQGQTYYLSAGPAVPDQASGITASGAASTSPSASPSGFSGSSGPTHSMSSPPSTGSSSPSASASSGSSSKSGAPRSLELNNVGSRLAYTLVFCWVVGVIAM